MTVQDFARILRTRSRTICGAIGLAALCALAYGLLATPQYEAKTQLFVSTATISANTGTPNSEAYQGGLFAKERVLSYTTLLTGELVAQRTIDKLGLDMSVAQLQKEVTATSPTDTVLIDVTVTDPSPTRASDIANTLSDEFVVMAAGLERPDPGEPPNARVVVQQRAGIPQAPSSPQTGITVVIAVVLGAVIGTILAIVREFRDKTVRRPETVEEVTGVGLIGDVPFDGQHDGPLISFGDDRSTIVDTYRELRISLQSLEVNIAAEKPRVVLVASAVPGEGRTTTALNLAISLAEADNTVAVVDADLRHPQVGSSLDVDGAAGLTTVLTGQATLSEALQKTRFPRLSTLTAGAVPSNPTELLGSQAARDVFDELGRQFDYVVIDSPSLQMTDAAILAGRSQGVLMVVRSGRPKREQVRQAINTLERIGAPVLGSVLTMSGSTKRRAGRPRRGSHQK